MSQLSTAQTAFLTHRGRLLVVFSVTFILAAAIRLYYLDASRVNGEHQYESALMARKHYLAGDAAAPEWRKQVVVTSLSRKRLMEPPVFPFVTSLGYRLLGRETLAVPRLLATCAWFVAGLLLILLTRRLASTDAAWVAAVYFLFVPSGIQLSVSFLPDLPMIMLTIASFLAIVGYFKRPSPVRFAAAWALSASAIVIKPVCMFPIAGGIIGLALHGRRSAGWRKRLVSAAALLVLSMSSGSAYYLLRILRGDEMAVQAGTSFVPGLLLQASYWTGWLDSASWAVGFVALVVAVVGVAAMPAGRQRAFVIGLWGGYVAYCLLFTYHIRFAGHYHLMLVPIVALSFAPLVPRFFRFVRETGAPLFGKAIWAGVFVLALVTVLRSIRNTFDAPGQLESPRTAAEIGEIVRHSTNTVFLASYYGTPLEYYGELAGTYWQPPRRDWTPRPAIDSETGARERFSTLGFQPEYFIITDLLRLRAQEVELQAFLSNHCTLLAESPEYLVYELRDCLAPE